MNGVPDDIIRLHLFPFSLWDKAKSWYQTLQLGANPVWGDLADLFLRKFHPLGLTLKLKMDILQFQQFDGETLAETWERYQEKLKKCPSHGFDESTQVVMFYNACGERTRMFMDTAAGGSLLKRGSSEAMEIIENMATTCYQWPSERIQLKKVAAASSLDPMTLFATQIAELTSKINALTTTKMEPDVENPMMMEEANFVNNGNFQRGFYITNGVINEEKKPNLEELLMKYITKSNERMERIESTTAVLGTQMKMFETQLGQVANATSNLHQSGKFPSNTTVNPNEHCMAVGLKSAATFEGSHRSCEMGDDPKKNHEGSRRVPPPYRPP
ncbi:uncharacterized protein LOC130998233 [Salvia miltiorrhiza]|uniref:uncharacterized protein LOC130998233 n=1 Tax=Salvia miltiorrhiza TaxID=226208 RepID=UPI0025AB7470|nr:uncharacterized protein LOC130998233 [Salvia miltiorrhiza]